MPQYKYTLITREDPQSQNDFVDLLNKMAQQGWEQVETQFAGRGDYLYSFLLRMDVSPVACAPVSEEHIALRCKEAYEAGRESMRTEISRESPLRGWQTPQHHPLCACPSCGPLRVTCCCK